MVPLMAKHGIKLVGGWASVFEHLYVVVYDAPSMEAFLAFSMEPEIMSLNQYNDNEVLPVMTLEEVMKLLNK